jgi:hypothetical protein
MIPAPVFPKFIACLGGSNTLGVRTTRGYPEHLPAMFSPTPFVFNRGLAGAKTLDVLRHLPEDMALMDRVDTVVFGLPTHDAQGTGVPPSELRALVEVLLHQLLLTEARIVLCTPTPVVTASPVRGFGRPSRRWVEKAVQVIETIGAEHEIPVVRWHTMPLGLMADAVHPGPGGCRWQAEQVAAALKNP